MDPNSVTVPLAFLAGALSFLSPCVLPLVPVYLTYLSGNTVHDGESARRAQVFTHALLFVAGFTLVFILLFGLPATLLGSAFAQYADPISRVGGVLVILFGLHTLGLLNIPFLNVTKQMSMQHSATPGYLRSALIGVTFAAGWTPCIGPLLGSVITMSLTQPTSGMLFTFIYAMGLALPFLLTALLLTRAVDLLRRLNRHALVVQRVSGVFLILIGILLATGQFATMNALFLRMTPDWLIEHL
jgi:cytochrome c-type biogenesis protein